MKSFLIISIIALTLFVGVSRSSAQTSDQKVGRRVTAAQVNGVYRFYKSTFRVLALGNNKLKGLPAFTKTS